jgi:hypothetical protein
MTEYNTELRRSDNIENKNSLPIDRLISGPTRTSERLLDQYTNYVQNSFKGKKFRKKESLQSDCLES